MTKLPEEVTRLFNEAIHKISQNAFKLMEELWWNWSHLGVDDVAKVNNINKLVSIEQELHSEVIKETKDKVHRMQEEVDNLKEETMELSRCLSVDIKIEDYKEHMFLVDYKRRLEDDIASYREQVQQRRVKMERLLEWQRDLAEKLGVTIQELEEVPLPSEEELDKLTEHLEVLQQERDRRTETFLNTQVEIKDIMEKLQIKPQSKFEHVVVTALSVDFQVTDLNMDRLGKLRQDLQEKYEQTNNRVLELRERLTKLWDCLEEDQIYRENFLQAHPGCHANTEAAIKEELKRCEQIKKQKIQVFVANMRTKIKLMWDNIMYSPQQREEFLCYFQDIFTEDTLTLHEFYLDKITAFYNEHKNIFDLVLTRKNLWLKMTELEARSSEPGRYHNRGGQLLKEEKERKCIANKLPKIEEQIRALVMELEAKTGTPFTVDGKPLLQLMNDDWEERKMERHNKLSARKQALTPTTPRSLALSPLGKRDRTAAGLAATCDRNRLPSKRQLITGSATKAATTLSNHSAIKRSAISTIKRRISGRLAAKALVEGKCDFAKRKLDYGAELKKTPKLAINGSILKRKRMSHGKRRSSSRRSMSTTQSTAASHEDQIHKDPLMESTMLTTYTDFKDRIHENQISRSSLAHAKENGIPTAKVFIKDERTNTPTHTPKSTPVKAPMTPKAGKENCQHLNGLPCTPKNGLLGTPNRITRSAIKLNHDGFATPRAPLSASKAHLQRQNTMALVPATTPSAVSRSKSQTHLVRAKNLPPLM